MLLAKETIGDRGERGNNACGRYLMTGHGILL